MIATDEEAITMEELLRDWAPRFRDTYVLLVGLVSSGPRYTMNSCAFCRAGTSSLVMVGFPGSRLLYETIHWLFRKQ